MKSSHKSEIPLEIVLDTIHVGSCRCVTTLQIDGNDEASKFLEGLKKSNSRAYDQLKARIKFVSKHLRYENDHTFNDVGDGVYEFKIPGIRLYAFYDELPSSDKKSKPLLLIVATNGGTKNKKKEQQSDINRAKVIRDRYIYQKTIVKKITFRTYED